MILLGFLPIATSSSLLDEWRSDRDLAAERVAGLPRRAFDAPLGLFLLCLGENLDCLAITVCYAGAGREWGGLRACLMPHLGRTRSPSRL